MDKYIYIYIYDHWHYGASSYGRVVAIHGWKVGEESPVIYTLLYMYIYGRLLSHDPNAALSSGIKDGRTLPDVKPITIVLLFIVSKPD